MAVRIYSLAKELSIDSKELVDVCARAGVTGKGSALASLTDDEVVKVTDFLKGSSAKSGPSAAATAKAPASRSAPAMVRPTRDGASDRLRTISAPKAGRSANARLQRTDQEMIAEATEETPAAADSGDQEPAVGEAPATETRAEVETSAPVAEATDHVAPISESEEARKTDLSQPGPLARMMKRDDYMGPGGAGGKMPVIGAKPGAGKPSTGKPREAAPKARPVVKLAALPTPAQKAPVKARAADDGPTQKPDMKLPSEVMGASRSGGAKPLAAQLKRAERTLEAAKLRDKAGAEEEAEGKRRGTPMLGGREARQLNRNRSGRTAMRPRRMMRRTRRTGVNTAAPRKDRIAVQLPCSVKELSEAAGVPAVQILRILMDEGVMTNINAQMDPELTEFIAAELGVDVDFLQPETLEDRVLMRLEEIEDPEESLVARAPVVTFLGHVDHGKTSLLDRLIGIDVAGGESGGITQHIRAYRIENNGRPMAFVDTPGHEAFTEMRARGAGVTDIVVLVVAADDGVMPQTEEAISHAKAAGVPIIVALNKIDLPGVDPLRAMTDLNTNGLQPSEWGGDTEIVKTSATTGEGLDELLETILTVAELNEYVANPDRAAIGTCLESQQDADRGVVTKVLVQNGTLKVGDIVVCGDAYGRVKAMLDPLSPRTRLEEAGPSVPVNLTGLDIAPSAGARLYVLDDIAEAREIAETRGKSQHNEYLGATGFRQTTLDTLFERLDGADEVQTLNLILRADVRGSIEALEKELSKLEHPEVRLRILQRSVGGVTEGDVVLADASEAVIIAFNVVADDKARAKASELGVEIRRYSIIYKVAEDLKLALEGLLKPEQREVELGRVLVQMTFKISRLGVIAGCRVLQGVVERNARARVIRDNTIVGDYPIDTLRREKDDAKEVREGYECGIKLGGFNDIKEADLLEVYKVIEVTRSFDD
ncbi:translation initiation factor IF-2 [Botrimarina hoheduenensis]|uniref:Translation initiation factor IF-2 n=1 Tax=Botrimarina hoheduenensis TaxID=2528000 RepID=A0A5C5VWW8_9BACT|nr:translation initiation factor IF-2 [Botrimarina hoheduenensis]TWT42505.1 Translation initiation factor IF-2 [Botrimarina hoheduenensis]